MRLAWKLKGCSCARDAHSQFCYLGAIRSADYYAQRGVIPYDNRSI